MNEKLKNAILRTIQSSAVEYKAKAHSGEGYWLTHSYRIKQSSFSLSINCSETADNAGFVYEIKFDKQILADAYVSKNTVPVRSAIAVDLIKIWNAAQEKYQAQERVNPMNFTQQYALFMLTQHLEK